MSSSDDSSSLWQLVINELPQATISTQGASTVELMNTNSITFLTKPKSKKMPKSKASSKRHRRINSEKQMEERDDELPWPPPDEAAIAIYNELISSHLKSKTINQTNFISNNSTATKPKEKTEKEFKDVQKKLEKYFVGNGKAFNILSSAGSNSTAGPSTMPLPPTFPCRGCSMPLAPASSEDVCTLFQNSCQISSGPSGGQRLPPIGVFWDLENSTIPKGRSALVAVQRIRDRFFPGHYEAEFVCVCDIRKEVPGVIQELNDAQVTVVHVSGNSKNAADDKLRQSMRRFADIYSGQHACTSSPYPATIVLISGDINFSSDLSDFRHRKKFYVILLHNKHASDALLVCAHEQYDFHTFLGNLPPRASYKEPVDPNKALHVPLKGGLLAMDVLVCDLPHSNSKTHSAIKNRLKKLSENCGGKVVNLSGQFALVRFPNKEAALRATKRMNGEDVLGSKIRVIYSSQMEFRNSEANFAVAQLHRDKLVSKRIFIDQGGHVDHETLKKEVASLLHDVPGASLPLFKFREMFEKRYRRSVSSSDLYRLRDVVFISEGNTNGGYSLGRTISLSHDWKAKDDQNLSLYCSIHPPKSKSKLRTGWAEKEADILLPNTMIELKTLSARVNSLLSTHGNGVPLISFLDCYEAEFGKMETTDPGSGGVPLEHLLACIQGVEISFAENGMKRLRWVEKSQVDMGIVTQPLALQLAQFGREMVDLLKTLPKCSLAFSKLIPAYHHHFGRQCRVADYGHISLQALLQTIPHVIQIMGAVQNRIITLSHKAQMKRFATDMLRVLKAHGGVKKQIKVAEFSQAFSQVFPTRQFCPEDYGLCYFSDLISELVENSTLVALLKDEEGNQVLAVPKREQTPQEMHRTRMFAAEVVELFRHSIRYEMPFSKFIPAYHHHFGKQCRVSYYGFSKLAELFEAITDTVVCISPQGPSTECSIDDKMIRLVPQEQVKVVGEQLRKLIQKFTDAGSRVKLSEIDELFIEEHGFQLRPDMFDAESTEDLVRNKLISYVKIDNEFVTAVDKNEMLCLMQDIVSILEGHPSYEMDLDDFFKQFQETFDVPLTLETIQGQFCDMLLLSQPDEKGARIITLAPLRIFAREITQLLEDFGGSLMLSNVDSVYMQKFGRPLRPAQMGYPSLIALLQAIPDDIQVRGKHRAKRVCIAGTASSDGSSFEESFSSFRRRSGDSFSNPRSSAARCYSAEQSRPYISHLKNDSGRWSDPQKRHRQLPATMYPSAMASPIFPTRAHTEPSVFTFDGAAPISPPMYDLWMREPVSPSTPPVSPPIVWTYHPIVYPHTPNTPPPTNGNIMMPTFSYTGQWSPAALPGTCYERMPTQNNGTIMGAEYTFSENRLSRGMERLGLGMDGRKDP